MTEQTLSQILAENLHLARQQRKMTQEELSKQSGIPRSTLTHLESGSGNPSLQTLTRLTMTLKISLEELLTAKRPSVQLFEKDEIPLRVAKTGVLVQQLTPERIPGVEFERLELKKGCRLKGTPHRQGAREYFYCVKGLITIYVEKAGHQIKPGQLLAFPGDRAHAYENSGPGESWGIGVVVVGANNVL